METDSHRAVEQVVIQLLEDIRLPTAQAIRLYEMMGPQIPDIARAAEDGKEWALQLVDMRYARWPGFPGAFDLREGRPLPGLARIGSTPISSHAWNVAELARRAKAHTEGKDAAANEGRRA